jgi:hypothetical protein
MFFLHYRVFSLLLHASDEIISNISADKARIIQKFHSRCILRDGKENKDKDIFLIL